MNLFCLQKRTKTRTAIAKIYNFHNKNGVPSWLLLTQTYPGRMGGAQKFFIEFRIIIHAVFRRKETTPYYLTFCKVNLVAIYNGIWLFTWLDASMEPGFRQLCFSKFRSLHESNCVFCRNIHIFTLLSILLFLVLVTFESVWTDFRDVLEQRRRGRGWFWRNREILDRIFKKTLSIDGPGFICISWSYIR